jgi:PAS domain S-box-containing protein
MATSRQGFMTRVASLQRWLSSQRWLALLALAVAYFVLAKVGLALASLHPSASPVWPPSGLALAAFLLWGNRVWPSIALGAFFANATTFGSLTTSVAIASGNTLEALVTAWLLERWSSRTEPFATPGRVAIFAVLTLAPGAMISATAGVGSLTLAGHANVAASANIWLTWWLGDVGGQLLVTPVVVLWARCDLRSLDRAELEDLGTLIGTTVGVGLLAFSPLIEQTAMRGLLAFLAIVPLLWAALRHNQRDTAIAALVLCVFAVWGALANGGPFAHANLNDSYLLIVMFVISTAVPSLVLSADVAVRKESERRYRTLVEDANDIVATLDLDMRFTSVNPAAERLLGYAPAELIGTALSQFVPHAQLPMHRTMLDRKLRGEAATQYEMQLQGKHGRTLTLEVSSRLIFDREGKAIGVHAISRDVSERKNAEARQQLLVGELQHRARNLLAVMQSIVSNTIARSRDLATAKESILGRLQALAHAQEFVALGSGGGVALRDLVEAEVLPFGARVSIEGIPVILGGRFAQKFALIVHELATNATKYGSLSVPNGRVFVSWTVTQKDARPNLMFSWVERGGPLVKTPTTEGFGTLLISAALKDAPRVAFKETGLELEIVVPFSEIVTQ